MSAGKSPSIYLICPNIIGIKYIKFPCSVTNSFSHMLSAWLLTLTPIA